MHLSPGFPLGQTRDSVFQLWQEVSLEEDLWLFVPMHFPVVGSGHLPSIVHSLPVGTAGPLGLGGLCKPSSPPVWSAVV